MNLWTQIVWPLDSWSSYLHRVGVDPENWIDYDACYLGLGETDSERRQKYRRLVSEGMSDKKICLSRRALLRGQLTGNDRFMIEIEKILGRRVEFCTQSQPDSVEGKW